MGVGVKKLNVKEGFCESVGVIRLPL